jgi:hypothetical protein
MQRMSVAKQSSSVGRTKVLLHILTILFIQKKKKSLQIIAHSHKNTHTHAPTTGSQNRRRSWRSQPVLCTPAAMPFMLTG